MARRQYHVIPAQGGSFPHRPAKKRERNKGGGSTSAPHAISIINCVLQLQPPLPGQWQPPPPRPPLPPRPGRMAMAGGSPRREPGTGSAPRRARGTAGSGSSARPAASRVVFLGGRGERPTPGSGCGRCRVRCAPGGGPGVAGRRAELLLHALLVVEIRTAAATLQLPTDTRGRGHSGSPARCWLQTCRRFGVENPEMVQQWARPGLGWPTREQPGLTAVPCRCRPPASARRGCPTLAHHQEARREALLQLNPTEITP